MLLEAAPPESVGILASAATTTTGATSAVLSRVPSSFAVKASPDRARGSNSAFAGMGVRGPVAWAQGSRSASKLKMGEVAPSAATPSPQSGEAGASAKPSTASVATSSGTSTTEPHAPMRRTSGLPARGGGMRAPTTRRTWEPGGRPRRRARGAPLLCANVEPRSLIDFSVVALPVVGIATTRHSTQYSTWSTVKACHSTARVPGPAPLATVCAHSGARPLPSPTPSATPAARAHRGSPSSSP
mmetsp:Transcript_55206/g.118697  ORF Transcript_55206/g.118697 Transcript_55206/m.118697 type:complete len:243 (-) Transcript_55206:376-1104(-)